MHVPGTHLWSQRPRDLHFDILIQFPGLTAQIRKGEPKSPNPQVHNSPLAALRVDSAHPGQERMTQVGCQQGQPGREGCCFWKKTCDEYGIYNLAISASIYVLC